MKNLLKFSLLIFFLCFFPLFSSSNVDGTAKPVIKCRIFIDNYMTCMGCVEPNKMKKLQGLELSNSVLDLQIFYSGNVNSNDYLDDLKKNYGLNTLTFIYDPKGFYAKHYNVDYFASIIIVNAENEVLLKEEIIDIDKYINFIKDLDSKIDLQKFYSNKIKGLKFLKKIVLKDKENNNFETPYDYYTFSFCSDIDKYKIATNILQFFLFDTTGHLTKEVITDYATLPTGDKIDFFANIDLKTPSDSIFIWSFYSLYDKEKKRHERNIIKLNVNTNEIIKYKHGIDTILKDKTAFSIDFTMLEDGRLIFKIYHYDDIYLDSTFKLLALTDTNYNIVKYFGVSDTLAKHYRLGKIMAEPFVVEYNSDIYFLQNNSYSLQKYDKNGDYLETIHLDLQKHYKILKKSFSEELDKREFLEYNTNYYRTMGLFIDNGLIYVWYSKGTALSDHCIDVFDMQGNRVKEIKIDLPCKVSYIKDNKILLSNWWTDKNISCYWYEIE